MLGVQGQTFLSTGKVPARSGNNHPVIAPYGTFEAQDGPLNIAPATERMWRALCVEVGLPDMADDPRFSSNERRVAQRELVHRTIEERIRLQPRAHWIERFIAAGIPAGPINRLDEVFADAQVRHCRMVREAHHPVLGAIPQLALPLHFAAVDVQEPGLAPPTLGEHSVAILRSHGFDDHEIDTLIARRIVGQPSATSVPQRDTL